MQASQPNATNPPANSAQPTPTPTPKTNPKPTAPNEMDTLKTGVASVSNINPTELFQQFLKKIGCPDFELIANASNEDLTEAMNQAQLTGIERMIVRTEFHKMQDFAHTNGEWAREMPRFVAFFFSMVKGRRGGCKIKCIIERLD